MSRVLGLCALMMALLAVSARAQTYVGPSKCKMCHDKPDIGDQYSAWQKTKHAHAYEELGTAKAKEDGKKMGVTDPQHDKRCLICHTTAYDAPDDKKEGIKPEDGVSCEQCHGPGSDYKPKDVHGEDYKAGVAAGMTDLRSADKATKAKTCLRCHSGEFQGNKAPNIKPFDFDKFYPKMAHPLPKKK